MVCCASGPPLVSKGAEVFRINFRFSSLDGSGGGVSSSLTGNGGGVFSLAGSGGGDSRYVHVCVCACMRACVCACACACVLVVDVMGIKVGSKGKIYMEKCFCALMFKSYMTAVHLLPHFTPITS